MISTQVPGAFAQAAFTKAGRVGVFRRFIVKEFGPAAVVDVAGGKGELSFELENLHDVACVVVDPRAPMLDDVSQRFRRFRARGFLDNGDEALSEGFRRRWREHEEAGVELALRRPRHLRLFFDGALVDWTVSGGDDFFAAAARRWTREVLIGESSRKQNYAKRNGRLELLPPPPDLVAAPDDAWSATSARAALVGADLLVGLHCDCLCGIATPSRRWLRKHVVLMAWGARNLISTQATAPRSRLLILPSPTARPSQSSRAARAASSSLIGG